MYSTYLHVLPVTLYMARFVLYRNLRPAHPGTSRIHFMYSRLLHTATSDAELCFMLDDVYECAYIQLCKPTASILSTSYFYAKKPGVIEIFVFTQYSKVSKFFNFDYGIQHTHYTTHYANLEDMYLFVMTSKVFNPKSWQKYFTPCSVERKSR